MFQPRKEPDPLRDKRRQLAEQERLLAERMAQLNDEIVNGGPRRPAPKANEPPVWRLEDDPPPEERPWAATSTNRRVLARQRRRDKILFFTMIVALIVVILLVLAVARSHAQGTLPTP